MDTMNDPAWVEKTLASMAPQEAAKAFEVKRGTMWHAASSERRGKVLWTSGDSVCLCFDETKGLAASSIYTIAAFLRLYRPV